MGQLRIRVQSIGDAELEVWAATRQLDALEEALGRKALIEKVPFRGTVNVELTRKKLPRNDRRVR